MLPATNLGQHQLVCFVEDDHGPSGWPFALERYISTTISHRSWPIRWTQHCDHMRSKLLTKLLPSEASLSKCRTKHKV